MTISITTVAKWNASQDPAAAGELGMDKTTGRPRAFVGGAAKNVLVEGDSTTSRGVKSVAGDTVLDATYDFVLVTATAAITLPTAAGITGKVYTIKSNADSITVTINTTGGQTVDGAASGAITLTQRYLGITVVSDGSNWMIWART